MILITGGLYQGKLEYALKKYNLDENDVSDFSKNNSYDFSKKILNNFHKYIEYCILNNKNISEITENLEDKIIITCETGCGIVPLKPEERHIREFTGRINCILAEKSESVIRVCCGLGIELKK